MVAARLGLDDFLLLRPSRGSGLRFGIISRHSSDHTFHWRIFDEQHNRSEVFAERVQCIRRGGYMRSASAQLNQSLATSVGI